MYVHEADRECKVVVSTGYDFRCECASRCVSFFTFHGMHIHSPIRFSICCCNVLETRNDTTRDRIGNSDEGGDDNRFKR